MDGEKDEMEWDEMGWDEETDEESNSMIRRLIFLIFKKKSE